MKIQLLSPAGEVHRHGTGIFKTALQIRSVDADDVGRACAGRVERRNRRFKTKECSHSIWISRRISSASPPSLARRCGLIRSPTSCAQGAYGRDRRRACDAVCPTRPPAHADALVLGYAEKSWPELLRDFARGELKPRYHVPTGRSLAGVPIARRDLLKKKSYATVNSIEATRGCPHKCDFCVVPTAWANTYAHRPIDEVIAELQTFEGKKADLY